MVPKADSGAFLLLFLLVLTVTEPLRPGARRGAAGGLGPGAWKPWPPGSLGRVRRRRGGRPPRRARVGSWGPGRRRSRSSLTSCFRCAPPPTSVREKSRARTQGSRPAQKAGARRAPVGCRGSKLSGKEPDAVTRTHKCVRFCIDAVAE